MKKFLDKIFLGALTALGFSTTGCDHVTIEPDMYGTPTAIYHIKGKVTDASRPGVGVEGIRMIFGFSDNIMDSVYARYYNDTVYTASDGTYRYNSQYRPDRPLAVWLKDVDGDANGGNFLADTVRLSFSADEWKQIGSWVREYTKDGLDFALTPGLDPEPEPAPDPQ